MPCNTEMFLPAEWERKLSEVACLLDQLNGKTRVNLTHWEGYHPSIYGKTTVDGDAMIAELCRRLQAINVSKRGKHMQQWWSEHQKADLKRLNREIGAIKSKRQKDEAITKLTDYERNLLLRGPG